MIFRQTLLLVALTFSLSGAIAAESSASQQIFAAGSQAPITGLEQFFTGHVEVQPLFPANAHTPLSGAYVTFAPGARSAWHLHPAGQHLVVTAGKGWVQEWGKPKVVVNVGDTVWCPPGVKHWHGAASDTPMTHMALTGVKDGKNVEWLEKVSDEQYQQ